MKTNTTRRMFMGAATALPAVPTLAQAAGARHIREASWPTPGFDPDAWLDRIKATGGGVWFTMDPMLPVDPRQAPAYADLLREMDSEAKRAAVFRAMVLREAVKIARGTDHIRDREAV